MFGFFFEFWELEVKEFLIIRVWLVKYFVVFFINWLEGVEYFILGMGLCSWFLSMLIFILGGGVLFLKIETVFFLFFFVFGFLDFGFFFFDYDIGFMRFDSVGFVNLYMEGLV